jgi:predicted PurR-regulated permease PerM
VADPLDSDQGSAAASDAGEDAVAGPPLIDDEISHRTASPAGLEAGTVPANPLGIPGPRFRGSPFSIGFGFALGALLAYALFEGAAQVSGPLLTITVAIFLAIGLDPIVSRLEARGMRRGFAIASVFIGFVLLLAGFVALIVPTLVNQLVSLVNDMPGIFDRLQENKTLQDLDEKYQILDKIQSALEGRIDNLVSGALGAAQLLASVVFQLLTITILTLYFLAAFHPMKAMAYRLAPASRRPRVAAITDAILLRAGGYVTGQLAISAIAGLAAYAWLRLVGVHFASALALLISVFSLIPMVGATIGSIIVSVVASTQSITLGIATLVFFILYQQVENYLIYPRIMKRAVNVHPAGALVGALIGGSLLGFVGAIIAVPVVAGLQLVIEEVVIPRQETV